MQLHHIAIASNNPKQLAEFYQRVFDIQSSSKNKANNCIYSVWIYFEQFILMIERSTKNQSLTDQKYFQLKTPGIHLLSFTIGLDERDKWKKKLATLNIEVVHETQYTLYFFDLDGNRIGLSHYPNSV